ncbi:unnamed protein product [Cuscuta epithymum]|uniref:Uncharacterized protein n=1 Tax=Cuscuta epithymum TaxID=186058 RepID=A0AAV0E053_9ASTE|nr:unnamed protein product [Cuscuta epithymum]
MRGIVANPDFNLIDDFFVVESNFSDAIFRFGCRLNDLTRVVSSLHLALSFAFIARPTSKPPFLNYPAAFNVFMEP